VYSICMNYTNRVKGNRPVGQRVFMQGGVCYNRAVPLAMATLTGKPIVVPPEPGLMGAFGVALAVGQRIEAGIMAETRFDLRSGCASRYDDYFHGLLQIGAQNPDGDNRRRFSQFLEWSVDQGLLGRRQAQQRYNRYFNVKYVSLMSDYSVCSETCPNRNRLYGDMQQERRDKELGLLKISADRSQYQRADRLFHETELVLEATCSACGAY